MQSKESILHQLYELVRPYSEKPVELGEETGLMDGVGLDSIKVMDLVMQIEDHFDISVPLNILPNVRTIGDLAKQLQKLLADN
jgi:acyl carrier protein